MGKTLEDARGEVQRGIDNVETACGIPSMMMGYGLEDGAARGIDEEVVYQPSAPARPSRRSTSRS
jgi:malonate-semialdehyde dehydrogenase (acetylating)/methylmalonate-semialdehyde dehydrogenase